MSFEYFLRGAHETYKHEYVCPVCGEVKFFSRASKVRTSCPNHPDTWMILRSQSLVPSPRSPERDSAWSGDRYASESGRTSRHLRGSALNEFLATIPPYAHNSALSLVDLLCSSSGSLATDTAQRRSGSPLAFAAAVTALVNRGFIKVNDEGSQSETLELTPRGRRVITAQA